MSHNVISKSISDLSADKVIHELRVRKHGNDVTMEDLSPDMLTQIRQACITYKIGQLVRLLKGNHIGKVTQMLGDALILDVNGTSVALTRYDVLPLEFNTRGVTTGRCQVATENK